MLDNFHRGEEETRGNKDRGIQEDIENTMDEACKQRRNFKGNEKKKEHMLRIRKGTVENYET